MFDFKKVICFPFKNIYILFFFLILGLISIFASNVIFTIIVGLTYILTPTIFTVFYKKSKFNFSKFNFSNFFKIFLIYLSVFILFLIVEMILPISFSLLSFIGNPESMFTNFGLISILMILVILLILFLEFFKMIGISRYAISKKKDYSLFFKKKNLKLIFTSNFIGSLIFIIGYIIFYSIIFYLLVQLINFIFIGFIDYLIVLIPLFIYIFMSAFYTSFAQIIK